MSARTLLSVALFATAALPTLSAQVAVSPGRLIGYTTDTAVGAITPPTIQRQTLCAPSTRVCPSGLGPVAAAWAGGAAYNSINASVWATQGTRLSEMRIEDCAVLCAAPAELSLGANSLATGLAVCESLLQLYQLESIPGQAAMHVRHLRSCPLNVLSSCRFALPTNRHIAGAMTIDEESGLFLYATSIFNPISVTGPQNVILVADASAPCTIVCRFPVDGCGPARLGPITAMTYDPCGDLLYVSDGRQTVVLQKSATAPCSYNEVRCCAPSPSAQTWHGFDIEPRHATSVGRSCSGTGCRNCANLELTTVGDPSIGNPFFALQIENGQTGGFAALTLGPGPCLVPGIPVLCGSWHVSNPVFLPGQVLAGSVAGGCDGTATWQFPIPKLWPLCDLSLCFQALILCPPTPIGPAGAALTNALEVTFSS